MRCHTPDLKSHENDEILIRVYWASIWGTGTFASTGKFKDRFRHLRILGHELSGVMEAVGRKVDHEKRRDPITMGPIIYATGARCASMVREQGLQRSQALWHRQRRGLV